ncbi:MAG: aminotransferase class I/II, partial [Sphaerochaetaceae bacterium]|nr:aminotransferase class I/II [Sphaerochaetaceae bacterium]
MKHALARRLDKVFSNTIIDRVLSRYGQRVYFPQGIVAQSQEAGTLAHFANATAGVALEKKHYMTHRVFDEFSKIVSTD